jgi:elongation factor 1 alpha-like protein
MPPKSGFSRTRNIDYDDDDDYYDEEEYDEEEAGEGTTEDDKEQMRVGTICVREALGEFEAGISDTQIHEALWHYYYDVGKSVTYLKNKLGGAQTPKETPKKEKAISKFDQAASIAVQNAPPSTGKYNHAHNSNVDESACPITLGLPPNTMPTYDADDFFWDVPWGNVPAHRLGTIVVDPPCGRRGLLGGSKLAALAAKRRKEREEAQAVAARPTSDADAAVAMLDKLSVADASASSPRNEAPKPRYPVRRRSPSPRQDAPAPETTEEPEVPQPAIVVERPAERAVASTFASTLCGSNPASRLAIKEFPVPYTNCKGYSSTNAFDTPSPDDIVRAAQAKGAGGGRR